MAVYVSATPLAKTEQWGLEKAWAFTFLTGFVQ